MNYNQNSLGLVVDSKFLGNYSGAVRDTGNPKCDSYFLCINIEDTKFLDEY